MEGLIAMSTRDGKDWKPATKLVRGGTMRSQFGETSEALFLTSGYAYDSADETAALAAAAGLLLYSR